MMLPIAAIDVGTNSVLLTIVRPRPDGTFEVLAEEAHITRIGEGIGTERAFRPAAIARTLQVLEDYASQCLEHGVHTIRAVGTAAFRHVTNAAAFIARVESTCGFALEVISGEREAALSYAAAHRDFGDEILVCDIGGGSTEFIWQPPGAAQAIARSLPLGSVALHERYAQSDPIADTEYEATRAIIQTTLRDSLGVGGGHAALQRTRRPAMLVALAGSATTLAAMHLGLHQYSHAQVHGTRLTRGDIDTILCDLRRRTIAERRLLPGLEAARADVILTGALLLVETMEWLGYPAVTISDRGVRWGLLYEAIRPS